MMGHGMAFAQAVGEYQARNLDRALSIAGKSLGKRPAEDASLYALIGKINFELGRKREAADAFVGVAERGNNAAAMLKLAATLYRAVGADADVLRIGLSASELNAQDAELAFSIAEVFFAHGALEDMLPLLARLDRKRAAHMALIINHHRLSGRQAALSTILREALASDPRNAFLRAMLYTIAHETCDLALMAEQSAVMADPDHPLAAALLAHEASQSRFTWCDDDAVKVRPSPESQLAAQSRPGRGAGRRAIAAQGERLRIGYLSNDFFDHATMTLLRDSLERHDRDRFDITLLCHTPASVVKAQESWPAVLRDSVVRVADLSDDDAAAAIDTAGIDILVDLKGHTFGSRPGIVNRSRAPLKVTYLGFPGSVAGVDLDYAITDHVVTPDASQTIFAEKLCRLPESYQANGFATRPRPGPASRAEHGLPEGGFVFASFNATYKINPETVDLWARVLVAVPNAIFWCMCPNPHAAENLKAALEQRGVARGRVVIATTAPYAQHVSRVALADLALDTWPCNGHTTTSDMLWAGLPVLAKAGGSLASRVSESLIRAVGLQELIAADADDYVARAVALATDADKLADLRHRLDVARFTQPLFDGERFVRHLEAAYDMMAARARENLAPDHLDVPALPPRQGSFRPD